MILSARYKDDKIIVQHAQRVGEQMRYCQDLAKDPSNGFTKDRSMRRIGSFPAFTLMEYDRLHPGWYKRAMNGLDLREKQKAWREFLGSDESKPFMMVEKLKH